MAFAKRGGRELIISPGVSTNAPLRPQVDNTMVKALARAFRWRNFQQTQWPSNSTFLTQQIYMRVLFAFRPKREARNNVNDSGSAAPERGPSPIAVLSHFQCRLRLSGEEREQLGALLRKGRSPAQRLLKVRILLKADVSEAGEGWSDSRIIQALGTSPSMVYRMRKQLVEEGFEAVLSASPARHRRFPGFSTARRKPN